MVKNLIIHTFRVHRMDAVCRHDQGVFCSDCRDSGPSIWMHTGDDKAQHSRRSGFLQKLRKPGFKRFQIEMAMTVDQAATIAGALMWPFLVTLYEIHKNHPNRLTTRSMIRINKPRRS